MTTPTIVELERRIADLEARAEEWDERMGLADGAQEAEPYEDNTSATIQAGGADPDNDAILVPWEDPYRIHCGCGEHNIVVSDYQQIYQFDAICPECGNHFGWDTEPHVDRGGER